MKNKFPSLQIQRKVNEKGLRKIDFHNKNSPKKLFSYKKKTEFLRKIQFFFRIHLIFARQQY